MAFRPRQGPISRLSHCCAANRRLWAFCLHCGHGRKFDPWQLAQKAGRDLTFDQLRHRLKCQRCYQRGRAVVMPDDRVMPGRD